MFSQDQIEATSLPGAYRIRPQVHRDHRGYFYESCRSDDLTAVFGAPFQVRQVNVSSSRRGTIRGIHSTRVPPGQAKLVTCLSGRVLDVAVDLRIGSPTFGRYDVTEQDAEQGTAVYLPDGVGHAYLALTEGAAMSYLCSQAYVPGTMIEINPLDPDIGIPWPLETEPIISAKDAAAPGIHQAAAAGILPRLQDCLRSPAPGEHLAPAPRRGVVDQHVQEGITRT